MWHARWSCSDTWIFLGINKVFLALSYFILNSVARKHKVKSTVPFQRGNSMIRLNQYQQQSYNTDTQNRVYTNVLQPRKNLLSTLWPCQPVITPQELGGLRSSVCIGWDLINVRACWWWRHSDILDGDQGEILRSEDPLLPCSQAKPLFKLNLTLCYWKVCLYLKKRECICF